MTEESTTKKKTTKDQDTASVEPAKVIRQGAIAASIWKRQSPSGFAYYDFTISRSWKTQTGKTGYSRSFFGANQEALLHVVTETTKWIAENTQEQPELASEPAAMAA
ncbi:hypothetical protein Pan44_07990 [Caulifigura coniformis]|uniref:Uncharacterized protein n=1 Tax=Caulifigura coniformis TaxID=2527983 RepID=A0A517S9H3_9PLAN|nr:hypothetical protein [Caulifigura coniformis]QDT52787.1 hypothetical protein Pan44_07990 [Caulifigura coniformis]